VDDFGFAFHRRSTSGHSRLSASLNNPEKPFFALTNVSVEALPDPEVKW
jgi:hypothetical protein